jgi:EAL domain-containing protein (putative c-di-GMP-specific phosphodiesterase class I)
MHKIDRLLMQAVLKQMTDQELEGETPQLFFANLSGDLLRHSDIVAELADALRRTRRHRTEPARWF